MLPASPADFEARSEEDQQRFFEDVLGRAHRAEAAVGTVIRDLVVAGQRIRLVYAGQALDGLLTPALAHLLASHDGDPDLLLHVWDSAGSGVEMCPPPVAAHCFSERGDIWTFESDRWKSAFLIGDYSLSVLDLAAGEGVCWVRSGTGLPYWTIASPFRALFNWWLSERDAQLVHGAVVGTGEGGVLIVGKGGVGKSTTALSCLAAGFDYVGDDYVVLAGGDVPTAFSLYQTAKLDPDAAQRFDWLVPSPAGGRPTAAGDKAVMHIRDHRPQQLAAAMPLRAVLTPAFADGPDTQVRPIAADALLGPALYTTMAQLPHAGPRTLALIERQVRRLPCYRLELGRDVDRVPAVIAALLTQLEGCAAAPPPARPRPLVSVVIPVYNGIEFLPAAIESILAQGYPALEIIVVDDGVGIAIRDAVATLPVEVRLLPKRNGGAADARNAGIRAASGELIAFLDVDDLWAPGKLIASVEWLEDHPATDVVIGGAQLFRQPAPGEPISFVGSPAESYPYYIGAGLYRRRAFEAIGSFDAGLRFGEDTDWFARAVERGLVVDRLEATSLMVRRHADNQTAARTALELVPLQLARNALLRKRGGAP